MGGRRQQYLEGKIEAYTRRLAAIEAKAIVLKTKLMVARGDLAKTIRQQGSSDSSCKSSSSSSSSSTPQDRKRQESAAADTPVVDRKRKKPAATDAPVVSPIPSVFPAIEDKPVVEPPAPRVDDAMVAYTGGGVGGRVVQAVKPVRQRRQTRPVGRCPSCWYDDRKKAGGAAHTYAQGCDLA